MKANIIIISLAVMTMTACSSEGSSTFNPPLGFDDSLCEETSTSTVTLRFSPYDIVPMTRATASISNFCTRLDLWIVEGENVIDLHQTAEDNLGNVSVTLAKDKTYTLYAIAHRCTAQATLVNGIISFPEDKVTHSMFYTTTFSPATTTTIDCLMHRIVGQFHIDTTDPVPDNVAKFTYAIPQTYTKYAVTGNGTSPADRLTTINVTSRRDDGTVGMSIYIIAANDATTTFNITVTALASDESVIRQRVFEDVPIRNGYRTNYRGAFFASPTTQYTFGFTVDSDWQENIFTF